MSIFISAGEVSGDLYGARLMAALQVECPGLSMAGLGGEAMISQGLELIANVVARSAVGLVENLPQVPFFLKLFQRVTAWLEIHRPRVIVLIDFQGFNLRLARWAKGRGIPTVYFVAPQEWLWGLGQGARRIAATVTHILAVFQPEAALYRQAGARVSYIGHPLLDIVPPGNQAEARQVLGMAPQDTVVCLMPGSRRLEVQRLLPVLLELADSGTGIQWLLPVAGNHLRSLLPSQGSPQNLRLLEPDQRYLALQAADLAICASGSVTLECALLGTPMVVVYKVASLTYMIARRLLKVRHIALPNILLGQALVPELLQEEVSVNHLAPWVEKLRQPDVRAEQMAGLAQVRQMLEPAGAFARAAGIIQTYLQSQNYDRLYRYHTDVF